jgi:hypothetical protein
MVMGYYRLGHFDDARRSMEQLMEFAREFRMDNPLVDFGSRVYQPTEPINLCYDSFGPPAAMIRGLFEYLYDSEGLTLVPHIPPRITRLEQHFPVRFGCKRLYLATTGSGPVTAVQVNGRSWADFDPQSIRLPYEATPAEAVIQVCLGGALLEEFTPRGPSSEDGLPDAGELRGSARRGVSAAVDVERAGREEGDPDPLAGDLERRVARICDYYQRLCSAGLADRYEAAHARLAGEYFATARQRLQMLSAGTLAALDDASQRAADQSYIDTVARLCHGLERTVAGYEDSEDADQRRVHAIWRASERPDP